MPTADEYRTALSLVTAAAVADIDRLVGPDPESTRDALLIAAPEVVAYYSDGSAALAADHYDELRDAANPPTPYRATPTVVVRAEVIRRGVLWSVSPLYGDPDVELARSRIAEVVQYETASPFRATVLDNARRDPASRGWQRITGGHGCKFCRMLADRGAVYKISTARFASHPNCDCTAAPAFHDGPEASAMQYVASQRRRTPAQRETLRRYLAALP